MKNIYALVLMGLVLMTTSCVSTKKLTYLQDKGERVADTTGFIQYKREQYKVQINDILSINIKTLNAEATALFNVYSDAAGGGNINASDSYFYLRGYSVDQEGNIELPIIGKLGVVDMTINDITNVIKERLYNYFKKDAVNVVVKLAGIRFSILGEVKQPGKYVIYQNQANIFEGIAMAGDLNTEANRLTVEIVRQYPEGNKIYQVDLTDKNIINSPNYFLQPNDIVYVKPLKVKTWGIGKEGFQTFTLMLAAAANILAITKFFE